MSPRRIACPHLYLPGCTYLHTCMRLLSMQGQRANVFHCCPRRLCFTCLPYAARACLMHSRGHFKLPNGRHPIGVALYQTLSFRALATDHALLSPKEVCLFGNFAHLAWNHIASLAPLACLGFRFPVLHSISSSFFGLPLQLLPSFARNFFFNLPFTEGKV